MVALTKLNGASFYLNPHQIEFIECVPDTTITMLSGKRIVVREKIEELLKKIVVYRQQIGAFKNEL